VAKISRSSLAATVSAGLIDVIPVMPVKRLVIW
jgi:hypothetical protein